MPSLNYGPVTQAGYRISQKIGHIVQPQLTTTSSWNVPPRPRVRKGLSFFKAQDVSLSATTLSSMWGEPTWSRGTAKKRRKTHQEIESKEASDPAVLHLDLQCILLFCFCYNKRCFATWNQESHLMQYTYIKVCSKIKFSHLWSLLNPQIISYDWHFCYSSFKDE